MSSSPEEKLAALKAILGNESGPADPPARSNSAARTSPPRENTFALSASEEETPRERNARLLGVGGLVLGVGAVVLLGISFLPHDDTPGVASVEKRSRGPASAVAPAPVSPSAISKSPEEPPADAPYVTATPGEPSGDMPLPGPPSAAREAARIPSRPPASTPPDRSAAAAQPHTPTVAPSTAAPQPRTDLHPRPVALGNAETLARPSVAIAGFPASDAGKSRSPSDAKRPLPPSETAAVPRPNAASPLVPPNLSPDLPSTAAASSKGSSPAVNPSQPVAANNSSAGLSVSTPGPLPIPGAPRPVVVPEADMQRYLSSSREAIYPPAAIGQHTGGTVVLNVLLAANGAIRRMDVVEGPPVFVKAAMTSVSSRRYRPYLVDGKPVQVQTRVRVSFAPR